MKKLTLVLLSILTVSALFADTITQAAARDGVTVTESMIMQMLRQQVGSEATDSQIRDAVSAQYKKPWDVVLKALVEQLTLQEYVKKAGAEDLKSLVSNPTDEQIQDFYNANKTKFVNSDMVRVNHIFFSTQGKTDGEIKDIKEKAEDAMLLIKQGKKSFDDLVQEVSDDKNSIKNGGELGFISRDDPNTVSLLGNDFIDAVFNAPMDGAYGVFKSNQGYHIVVISEKRSARILKLTDKINPSSPATVSQYIQQNIQQQSLTQAFSQVTEKVIASLKKEATIKIIDRSIPWK
ncbi:MAG: hypothetical protein B6229_08325 [Spirochaetaceae bacterium 4572_7]|nr:MAG: hypothetical protein B6229_08325 [Spirochaetaceae bacterium 4572_7]